VLDIDVGRTRQKSRYAMADAQVALVGAFHSSRGNNSMVDDGMMDFESSGVTNQIFYTHTHLGSILQPGDATLGYFLTNANYNSESFADLPPSQIPDITHEENPGEEGETFLPRFGEGSRAREWYQSV